MEYQKKDIFLLKKDKKLLMNKNLHNIIMEYQKIANLIDDNTLNQPSKFRTRNWIEINDESRGAYNI